LNFLCLNVWRGRVRLSAEEKALCKLQQLYPLLELA
jgi:hypothetical protein